MKAWCALLTAFIAGCGGSSVKSGDAGSGGVGHAGNGGGVSGAPTGGSGGSTAGSSPIGGTGGSPGSGAECRSAADCRLSLDCWSCFAAGTGEATHVGGRPCARNATACALEGVTEANLACVSGRCVLDRRCDLSGVTCEIVEPECPGGTVPSAAGTCYGPCTLVTECATVPSCAACESQGLACVRRLDATGYSHQCVTTPSDCEDEATCSCMGVCQGEYTCADESSKDLSCDCFSC